MRSTQEASRWNGERLRVLDEYGRADGVQIRDEMVRALRRYFSNSIGKRPIVLPYVMEV